MEKVGILGSAVVGQTLAQGFKAARLRSTDRQSKSRQARLLHRIIGSSRGHARSGRGLGRAPGPGGAGDWCGSGPEPCRRGQSPRQDRHRYDQSDHSGSSGRRCHQVLHRTERVPARAAAGCLPRYPPRQGVQQRRQPPHGQSGRTPEGGRRCSSAGTTRRPRPGSRIS